VDSISNLCITASTDVVTAWSYLTVNSAVAVTKLCSIP